MKHFLSALLALLLGFSVALAESSADQPVATVNGDVLLYSEYYAIESAYLANYQAAGIDLSDETTIAYLQDLALTYAVEQMLVRQDMQAQGCYDFDHETETWFQQTGKAAYDAALNDVKASFLASQPNMDPDEADVYALAYAKSLNVTPETYVTITAPSTPPNVTTSG